MFARVEREAAVSGGLRVDDVQLDAYLDAHERMTRRRGTHGVTVDFAGLLRLPGVLVEGGGEDEPLVEGTAEELVAIVAEAARALTAMRGAEGARIADVLRERVALMEAAYGRIAERAPSRLVEQRDRLRAAVRELADGVAVDEGRLAQEVAVLADRLDVSEEIDRFRAHVAAFRGLLDDAGAEPVGNGSGSCSRRCSARPTRPAARPTTPACSSRWFGEGGARAGARAGGERRVTVTLADLAAQGARAGAHPFPIILSAPSGGGKTTIARRLLAERGDLGYSVSCTTRAPRAGEVHGRDYFFLSARSSRRRATAASSPSGRRCTATSTARSGARSTACSPRGGTC
jgi:hypothetical protein